MRLCITSGCHKRARRVCGDCGVAEYCGKKCALIDYEQHHRYEHHLALNGAMVLQGDDGEESYSASYEWDSDDDGEYMPMSSYIDGPRELLQARAARSRGHSRRGGGRHRRFSRRKAVTRARDAGLTFAQKAKRRRIPVDTFRKRVLKNPHFYEEKTVKQAHMNARIHGIALY